MAVRSRSVRTIALVAMAAMLLPLAAARANPPFFQGFEMDTGGWSPNGSSTITRAASGSPSTYAPGIASATDGFHARLGTGACTTSCSGPSTRWGGYRDEFPPTGFDTEVKVYLDTTWAQTNVDKRFDFSSALTTSSNTFHQDYVFNFGTHQAVDLTCTGFWVTASTAAGRSNANPKDPARQPQCITTAGWYTLQHQFRNEGGNLVVHLRLLAPGGALVHQWDITNTDPNNNPNPAPISAIGGNRYGWFANQEIPGLAIDDSLKRPVELASSSQVVTDTNPDGWAAQHTSCDSSPSTGGQQMVFGPGSPPSGDGSRRFVIDESGNSYEAYRYDQQHGTRLLDLTQLSYWTFVQASHGGQAPFMTLNLDWDGNNVMDEQLYFEPVYQTGQYGGDSVPNQGAVANDEWQHWDALAGGWWSNLGTTPGAGQGGPPLVRLATVVNQHPNVRIINVDGPSGAGGVRIGTGCGGPNDWGGFVGYVDDVTIEAGAPGNPGAGTSDFERDLQLNVAYRVNAGGPVVTDSPNWEADTQASPSPYYVSGPTQNHTASYGGTTDTSQTPGVPAALFPDERWDPAGAPTMRWAFPVPNGADTVVRLYFSERYPPNQQPGGRVFDVNLEGAKVLDDFDVYAESGGLRRSIVREFEVTSDGTIDIEFLNQTGNPKVNAIEILTRGAPAPAS